MSKDLDEKVEKLEAAVDPNTVISVGGYNFTPAKLMIAGAIVSSTLGFLYGTFEVYKDYMSMKEAIANYVTPDLSEINKKLAVVTENSNKAVEYTQDIKNDLKSDIRRLEGIVDGVERSTKQTQRELDGDMKILRKETEVAIKETNANLDRKIQRALDNPLANGK
jgi:tetrahydromethanopterin S-methyltransferase subunit B